MIIYGSYHIIGLVKRIFNKPRCHMLLDQRDSAFLYISTADRPQDLLITLLSLAILLPVCLWVFRDARNRYPDLGRPLLWAVLVFLVLIVFLPLYLFVRPPKR